MKKVSLIIVALAMVLGISQCKKQDDTVSGKVITQKVTFTTSFGDGSKLNVTETGGTLGLKWQIDDEITVTDGAGHSKTLKCTDVSSDGLTGTFTGEIEYGLGELTFTVGTEPDYMNQHFTSITENEIYLKGTSEFKQDGDYYVGMSLPYAILKVDLSDLAPVSGSNDVSVKINDDEIAIVTNVSNASANDYQVYLLLPLMTTGQTTLTFTNTTSHKTITHTYTLAPNGFYTAGGNGGMALILPDGVLPGLFTVSAGEDRNAGTDDDVKVHFSQGNLYYDYDRNNFNFEANQYGFESSWKASHVSHFFWSKDKSVACATSYSELGTSDADEFFTNAGGFKVNVGGKDQTGWRTLSKEEWEYLSNSRTVNGGQGLDHSYSPNITYGGKKGLVLYPDDYTGSALSGTVESLPEGVVFLPAAGNRNGESFYDIDSYGNYWSSSANEETNASAGNFGCLTVSKFDIENYTRNNGFSVRLVTKAE